jgi:hypothetical protein
MIMDLTAPLTMAFAVGTTRSPCTLVALHTCGIAPRSAVHTSRKAQSELNTPAFALGHMKATPRVIQHTQLL